MFICKFTCLLGSWERETARCKGIGSCAVDKDMERQVSRPLPLLPGHCPHWSCAALIIIVCSGEDPSLQPGSPWGPASGSWRTGCAQTLLTALSWVATTSPRTWKIQLSEFSTCSLILGYHLMDAHCCPISERKKLTEMKFEHKIATILYLQTTMY